MFRVNKLSETFVLQFYTKIFILQILGYIFCIYGFLWNFWGKLYVLWDNFALKDEIFLLISFDFLCFFIMIYVPMFLKYLGCECDFIKNIR